jgi:hypothetical protein
MIASITPSRTLLRRIQMSCLILGVLFLSLPDAAIAAQTSEAVTVESLRKELQQRDAIIIDLLRRVRALEQGGVADAQAAQNTVATTTDASTGDAADTTASGHTNDAAVDPVAAERALERSLAQEGYLLFAPGQVELSPALSFARFENGFPTLLTQGGTSYIADIRQKTNVIDGNIALRVGLPLDSQLELAIPYRVVQQHAITRINGVNQSAISQSGAGVGDIRLGIAKQFAEQAGWRPNLVARVSWLSGSGKQQDNGVALGGGQKGFGVQTSAYWRRDPVVFLLGGGYDYYADNDGVRPGNAIDISLGAALAVSPETALTLTLDQSFAKALSLRGTKLAGTERTSSVFNVSAATILGRSTFLRLNLAIGLTEDSPDYRLDASLPFRLGASQ